MIVKILGKRNGLYMIEEKKSLGKYFLVNGLTLIKTDNNVYTELSTGFKVEGDRKRIIQIINNKSKVEIEEAIGKGQRVLKEIGYEYPLNVIKDKGE